MGRNLTLVPKRQERVKIPESFELGYAPCWRSIALRAGEPFQMKGIATRARNRSQVSIFSYEECPRISHIQGKELNQLIRGFWPHWRRGREKCFNPMLVASVRD
jgi:hypothetical protein